MVLPFVEEGGFSPLASKGINGATAVKGRGWQVTLLRADGADAWVELRSLGRG